MKVKKIIHRKYINIKVTFLGRSLLITLHFIYEFIHNIQSLDIQKFGLETNCERLDLSSEKVIYNTFFTPDTCYPFVCVWLCKLLNLSVE